MFEFNSKIQTIKLIFKLFVYCINMFISCTTFVETKYLKITVAIVLGVNT